MSLTLSIGGVDLTDRLRIPEGFQTVSEHADGSAATAGLIIDDPDGDLIVGRLQPVIIEEDDCSEPRVFTGWVQEAKPSRGPYRSGASRIWNVDVGDLNLALHFQAFHTADAKRPQETLTARRDWLLGTTPASYFVNNGFFPTFSGLFDEADYQTQYVTSVLEDFQAIGRVAFLYWDDPDIAIYCAQPDDGFATSTLSISNVLADLGPLCVLPDPASELDIEMDQVFDEVIVNWAGGSTFLTDYDGRLPAGIHRTGVFETPRVGRLATAVAEAQILLDRCSGDINTITCTVLLTSSQVNLARAGMLVPVKFSHLPGYESFTNLRVAQRTVNLAQVTDGEHWFYPVTMTLTRSGPVTAGGGGTPPSVPPQPSGPPEIVQQVSGRPPVITPNSLTLPNPPTPGNTFVAFITAASGPIDLLPGWTEHPDGLIGATGFFTPSARMAKRTVTISDTATVQVAALTSSPFWAEIWEVSGDLSSSVGDSESHSTLAQPATVTAGSVSPTSAALILAGICVQCGGWPGNGDTTIGTDAAFTRDGKHEIKRPPDSTPPDIADDDEPLTWSGHLSASSAGTYATSMALTGAGFNFGGWGGLTWAFIETGTSTPPRQGDPLGPETVTMSGADGTTQWPFATGSLHVFVDDTEQTSKLVAQDGAAGTFTLGFTPTPTEVVVVYYQAR